MVYGNATTIVAAVADAAADVVVVNIVHKRVRKIRIDDRVMKNERGRRAEGVWASVNV